MNATTRMIATSRGNIRPTSESQSKGSTTFHSPTDQKVGRLSRLSFLMPSAFVLMNFS